jgi:hypothetical protein
LRFDALKAAGEVQMAEDAQHVSVKLFDKDAEIKLTLSKSDDKHYAKLTGENPLWNDWVYEISEYNFNQLVKDKMDYLDENKPAEAPSTADASGVPVP